MLAWFSSNATGLGVLIAALTLCWSAIQFIFARRREQQTHEFEAYHQLIKELVAPDPTTQKTWLDRQVAIVFELRHFPRYYDVTSRIVSALRNEWAGSNDPTRHRLIHEMDLTLRHIAKNGNPTIRLTRAAIAPFATGFVRRRSREIAPPGQL